MARHRHRPLGQLLALWLVQTTSELATVGKADKPLDASSVSLISQQNESTAVTGTSLLQTP